jgi:hypothetical protein
MLGALRVADVTRRRRQTDRHRVLRLRQIGRVQRKLGRYYGGRLLGLGLDTVNGRTGYGYANARHEKPELNDRPE